MAPEGDSDEMEKKYYDENGKFHWSGASSSGSESDGSDKSGDEEEGENDLDDKYDSASYSDDVSGVWSLNSDQEGADTEKKTSEEIVGTRFAVR